jgi:GTP1/Obg family GTP-binding protein
MIMSGLQSATAQECAQEVLRDLYADLEKVDIVGEERLARSLDKLSKQEGWSEKERGDYTLAIADTKAVDAAESQRTEILGRLFGLAQRGDAHCLEMRDLRSRALELEQAQWDAAVQQVEQKIWH